MSQKTWSPDLIKACSEKSHLDFLNDAEMLARVSKDFGALSQGTPTAVVFPQTSAEVEALFVFANKNNLTFTVRGGGYSQSGHTLAPKGAVTLDCSQMIKVDSPNFEELTVKCQSGATWSSVVAVTSPYGLVPKVIPFFPGLTVGGVLSVGGIGGNSHLYGCVSGNVKELEVVTGLGENDTCSLGNNSSLFEAILCGLGRCGVITTATMTLRKYKPHVKTFYLHYDNHEDWLVDQKHLGTFIKCDYLEAFCSPVPIGLHQESNGWKPLTYWFYTIQASFEYDEEEPTEALLKSLTYKKLIHSSVSDTLDFLTRYATRAESIKKSGNWDLAHPWWECMLPIETMSQVLPSLLKRLPLTLGDGLGYRVFSVNENCPTSFMKPSTPLAMGFAALPIGVPSDNLQQVLDSLQAIDEWLLPMGGKRYLPGWLGNITQSAWQSHYGAYYPEWIRLKEKYDPNGVLQSLLLKESVGGKDSIGYIAA